ncbi:fam-a protein [Plasmodium vinckei petteri]|uniref:Fam-a protein n=1 Tax=Plasmodium vinckei petteri TaxID=138298 RepID=A0A6V7SFD3_PLAVN|nr:fam-a protein [Plasmodium vinckei petteri]
MNKFYIQVVLFLLSTSLYVNNNAFATELGSKKAPQKASNKTATSEPTDPCLVDSTKEIDEKKKDILCTNPKEAKEAEELMNEAVKQLEIHATGMHNYKLCVSGELPDPTLYKKKLENKADVEKVEYSVYNSDKYDEIINEIWNPDHPNPFNKGNVKTTRVYNPNLVMIQQRCKKKSGSSQKYFYALATKAQISEDTTVIAYTSANINDHNPSKTQYENKIIQKANLFKTEINSEEDIRKGKLKKMFVNLAGYYIQKHGNTIDVTYVESIDGHASIKYNCFLGLLCNGYYLNV